MEFNENQRLYNETRLEKLLNHSNIKEIKIEKIEEPIINKTVVYPTGSIFFLGDISLRFTNALNSSKCKIYSGDKYEHIKLFPFIGD